MQTDVKSAIDGHSMMRIIDFQQLEQLFRISIQSYSHDKIQQL